MTPSCFAQYVNFLSSLAEGKLCLVLEVLNIFMSPVKYFKAWESFCLSVCHSLELVRIEPSFRIVVCLVIREKSFGIVI